MHEHPTRLGLLYGVIRVVRVTVLIFNGTDLVMVEPPRRILIGTRTVLLDLLVRVTREGIAPPISRLNQRTVLESKPPCGDFD